MSADPRIPLDGIDRVEGSWGPDVTIIEPTAGEHVWLTEVTKDRSAANREAAGLDPAKAYAYITDCCLVSDPCAHHAQIARKFDTGGGSDVG